jgi:neutral trehalase
VFSDEPGRGFALRVLAERGGERADREDFHYLIQDLGPHAGDGSYARIAFDTHLPFGKGKETPAAARRDEPPGLELEWSRIDALSALLRARAGFAGILELRGYFPWDWKGDWFIKGGKLFGATEGGGAALGVNLTTQVGVRSFVDGEEAVWRLAVQPGVTLDVLAVLGVSSGEAEERMERLQEELNIDDHLERASERYESTRVAVVGPWEGIDTAVTDSLRWTVALKPELGRLYTPAGRSWIFPAHRSEREHWTLFCWDSFLNALELAIEDPEKAMNAVEAVLESQYPSGNVPNWRGRFAGTPDRSQPPVGSLAVLKIYLRTKDRSFLERAFPYLERWSSWWRGEKSGRPRRRGNYDGLFTWGSDGDAVIDSPAPWENEANPHQRAAWESGQDDLPNWDEAGWNDEAEVFGLDAVDLNSYLALDLECLSKIASVLGEEEKAEAYRGLNSSLCVRVNEVLWNEAEGMYMDRFREGSFSSRLAASNFLPLLAGIPSRERAERMLKVLTDTSRFWGEYVIPSISRNDPAFADQQYWRGAIWPPVNYLVYGGLRRYGFDETAAELAMRSVDLLLAEWRQSSSCRENYDSRTGEGCGHRHQSWGPLLALMGIDEFIDVTPWDGLRLGSLYPKSGSTLERIRIDGHEWTVSFSAYGTKINLDGKRLLESSAPIVLRHVGLRPNGFDAETYCRRPVRLTLSLDGTCRDRMNIEVEGNLFRSVSNAVIVPEGRHKLHVTRVG